MVIASDVALVRQTADVLALRLLPFAAYGVLRRRTSVSSRFSSGLAYALVAALACSLGGAVSVAGTCVGYAYYLAISLGTNRLSRLVASGAITHGGLVVVLFVAYLLLPGVLVPGLGLATFLIAGWDLALSAYSYCIETSRPRAPRAAIGDCLFFLFVNPTVFYAQRGAPLGHSSVARGLLRASLGCSLLFISIAILGPLTQRLRDDAFWVALSARPAARPIAFGITVFACLYAAHSGLASLQIGLMRASGWVVPERYRYPILSTSPIDFWRRWNTYLRVWLEAYVFLPLAMRGARRRRRWSGPALAAVATLCVNGLIHDAVPLAGVQRLVGLKTPMFLAAGALMVPWWLAAQGMRWLRARFDGGASACVDLLSVWFGHAAMTAVVIGAAWKWG